MCDEYEVRVYSIQVRWEPTNFLDQSLNGILHTKLDLNYQKKSREK